MTDRNLPIRLILWAGNRSDHKDHLHVEGVPLQTGTPPKKNPGPTYSLNIIINALNERFEDWPNWGVYYRRPKRVDGRERPDLGWSQHAYANAVDIGPVIGQANQQVYYDFLTGKENHMAYEEIAGYKFYDVDKWPKWADANIRAAIADGMMIGQDFDPKDPRKRRFNPEASVTRAELATVLKRAGIT